jgi:hypothetical protein
MLASLLLPKRQKILSTSQAQEFVSFLYAIETHIFKTSGYWCWQKECIGVLDIVQMKRNGSDCPTGRNLDKLSLNYAGRKSLHA